jgi:acid phosphatase type 7
MRAGIIAALIAVAAGAALAAVSFTVKNSGGGTPSDAPVIAAAGDIADSGSGDEATARLLDAIAPTAVLTTGDNAYDDGTLAQFKRYYDPTWGRHRAITHPVPGNHDYNTAGAAGYFDYFGRAARDPARPYYSFDLGAWHLIALNSELPRDMRPAQVAWLKRDLAASGAKCTLAYWHRPRFTAGKYSDFVEYTPLWKALWDANADVVLAGHDHNYQRYRPLNPAGMADSARGIRQFVVGTGGRSRYALRPDSRRVAGTDSVYGVLKLTLHPASFDFTFVPEAGQTYSDSGKVACH